MTRTELEKKQLTGNNIMYVGFGAAIATVMAIVLSKSEKTESAPISIGAFAASAILLGYAMKTDADKRLKDY